MSTLTVSIKVRNLNTWIHKIILRFLLKKKGLDAACKFYTKWILVKIGNRKWRRYYDFLGAKDGEFVLVEEGEE